MMKKLTFFCCFAILAMAWSNTTYAGSICTPDPQYADSSAGFYPDDAILPCAERGMMYNQTVTFAVGNEFDASGFIFPLNWIRVDSLSNNPCGINLESDRPLPATYFANETGCVSVTGITQEPVGQYILKVSATVSVAGLGEIPVEDACAFASSFCYYFRVNDGGPCAPVDTNAAGLTAQRTCAPAVTCTAPASVSVTNVQPRSVRLNWDAVTGVDHYVIQGNRVGAGGMATLQVAGTSTQKAVGGLQEGTDYWWQIKACCDAAGNDCSPLTTQNIFSTKCDVATNLAVTNLTSNSARLTWSGAAGNNGYTLRGRRVGGSSWTTVPSGNTTVNTGAILQPNTSYEWQVRTECSGTDALVSGWTALNTFTTLAAKADISASASVNSIEMNLFPNPAANEVTLAIGGDLVESSLQLMIIDLSGKTVVSTELNGLELLGQTTINTSDWADGVYQVVLKGEKSSKVSKLIIAR